MAERFAEKRGKTFAFSLAPDGTMLQAGINFTAEERLGTIFETVLDKVLWLEEHTSQHADLALLKLASTSNLPPVPLADDNTPRGDYVGVLAYTPNTAP